MGWAEPVARKWVNRNEYRIFLGKPEGRIRRIWEDIIKMDLKETRREGVD
jgi:hypothetical protein